MKKKILTLVALSVFSGMTARGEVLDSIRVYGLEEVSVTSLLRNNITTGSIIGPELLLKKNHGQGPVMYSQNFHRYMLITIMEREWVIHILRFEAWDRRE